MREVMYEWIWRRRTQLRVSVEHSFLAVKNLFEYRKVDYLSIAENQTHAKVLATVRNLFIATRRLIMQRVSASAA